MQVLHTEWALLNLNLKRRDAVKDIESINAMISQQMAGIKEGTVMVFRMLQ